MPQTEMLKKLKLLYNTGYSENLHSYVNNINTIERGPHTVTRVTPAHCNCRKSPHSNKDPAQRKTNIFFRIKKMFSSFIWLPQGLVAAGGIS